MNSYEMEGRIRRARALLKSAEFDAGNGQCEYAAGLMRMVAEMLYLPTETPVATMLVCDAVPPDEAQARLHALLREIG
ncbi:MAG: hypothetical protein ACREQ4_03535 [Candidatus Binataceae bacterium]